MINYFKVIDRLQIINQILFSLFKTYEKQLNLPELLRISSNLLSDSFKRCIFMLNIFTNNLFVLTDKYIDIPITRYSRTDNDKRYRYSTCERKTHAVNIIYYTLQLFYAL